MKRTVIALISLISALGIALAGCSGSSIPLVEVDCLEDQEPNGGPHRVDSIFFRSLFYPLVPLDFINPDDSFVLTLHVDGYVSGPPYAFQIFTADIMQDVQNQNLRNFYEVVRNAQSSTPIHAELICDEYIIIRTDNPNLRYVMFTYAQTPLDRGRGVFNYMPMQGQFFDQDVFALDTWQVEHGTGFAVDVPYHLFDDHLLFYFFDFRHGGRLRINPDLAHQSGHYYRIYGSMADFRAFYEGLGLYEITEADDQLILEGLVHQRSGAWNAAGVVNGRIILSFREENGQRYVAYSFEAE